MKYILPLLMLMIPLSALVAQPGNADSLLHAERSVYYQKYLLLMDTITVKTWVNMKRLNDNLEKIVEIDNQLFDSMQPEQSPDSLMIAGHKLLEERYNQLSMDFDKLRARTENDLNMMVFLKLAVGVLAAFLVMLIFVMIGRNGAGKQAREQAAHYEKLFEEKRIDAEALQVEVERLKKREEDFRGELEKGLQLNLERIQGLQDKCKRLEQENLRLEQSLSAETEAVSLNYKDYTVASVPENADETLQLIRNLSEERDSLLNLAGQLQKKLVDEKMRRKSILDRIDAMVQGLSRIGDT